MEQMEDSLKDMGPKMLYVKRHKLALSMADMILNQVDWGRSDERWHTVC
jgi:hypothetical protein